LDLINENQMVNGNVVLAAPMQIQINSQQFCVDRNMSESSNHVSIAAGATPSGASNATAKF